MKKIHWGIILSPKIMAFEGLNIQFHMGGGVGARLV